MKDTTIIRSNREAQDRFLELAGSQGRRNRLVCEIFVDSKWFRIELKFCGANRINQVRANLYKPLVVYQDGFWYIVPPDDVYAMVARYSGRGQHSFSPLETKSLNIDCVAKAKYKCQSS